MEYFIVKLQHDEILVWYPAMRGFKRIIPQPYFSLELAKRIKKRILRNFGGYNRNFVEIVNREQLNELLASNRNILLLVTLLLYGYYFYCFGSCFGIEIFDLIMKEAVSLETSLIKHFECFGS